MANVIKVLKPDHIVLNVQDMEAALHFYTEVLGLEVERLAEFRAGKVGFPSVRMGEQLIDLFPEALSKATELAPDKQQRVNHFCLVIENKVTWAAIKEHLAAHNVTILGDVQHNWGAWGNGYSLYMRDPDNNVVELKQYPD